MPPSLSEILLGAVRLNPEGTATSDGGERRAWRDVSERVARLGGGLQATGVQDGSRVAVLALNSARFLELYFAVPWAGGVIVPLNHRLAEPELEQVLRDASPHLLVAAPPFLEMAERLAKNLTPVPRLVSVGQHDISPSALRYEDLIALNSPARDAGRGGQDLAAIFYTGGTTGAPKGVMLSHASLSVNAAHAAQCHKRDWEIFLHAAPMYHIGDMTAVFGVTLLGGRHEFLPRFNAGEALLQIAKQRITSTTLVPTSLAMLLDHPACTGTDLGSLRAIRCGAAPLPAPLRRRAMARLPECALLNVYGLTETSVLAVQSYEDSRLPFGSLRLQSAGPAVPHVEVRIVDAEGRPLLPGEIGEILARGQTVMIGYWNQPALTAEALDGGWLHTGDLGTLDEEGYLFVVDRKRDVIVTGGENVYSAEVETVLSEHPAVQSCAVIGIPDDTWGERVHAIVVPQAGRDLNRRELLRHCRQRLAAYKCPRSIEIRRESLPVSGTGKVQKHVLRAPYRMGR